ncbi:MAG: thioredoxin domain-containing protein [Lentisphaeria bacterium]|nr:thioredoxin domain-containing protein [Lentisphaeria bacterium]
MQDCRRRNRLADSASPYLLQHAGNPVDWFPWGVEAFTKARLEDKPIFLSVGYSACHWCHVMERESFESPAIAALLNAHFVAVKVDREEHPDVDRLYMEAVQVMTGSGGWPMSIFLTPAREPFYAGTYFPPQDRYAQPGFGRVLTELARLWREDRNRLLRQARNVVERLARPLFPAHNGEKPETDELQRAAAARLQADFDPRNGGFGSAPKFPPAIALRYILRRCAESDAPVLRAILERTLDAMGRGGIFDHVGGGFHRYSVDESWLVPHFEKMLYDNAQLAEVYALAYRIGGHEAHARTARRSLDFLLRDMRAAEGAFHASLDADSEGREGRFYLWSMDELRAALGAEDAARFATAFGCSARGHIEGRNVLHRPLPRPDDETAPDPGHDPADDELDAWLSRLDEVRAERVPPARDDKVLTSWNALAVSAFAAAAVALDEPRYLAAANEAAAFLLHTMRRADGGLLHTWRAGTPGPPANLDDYAYLLRALLDLFRANGDAAAIDAAEDLARDMVRRFGDPATGTLYYTEAGRDDLLARCECAMDETLPAAAATAAEALYLLGRITDDEPLRRIAEAAILPYLAPARRYPMAFLSIVSAADAMAAEPEEVVVAGPLDSPVTRELIRSARAPYRPNLLVFHWDPDLEGSAALSRRIPLLSGKGVSAGQPTAYYCRGFRCLAPVVTPEALRQLLRKGKDG